MYTNVQPIFFDDMESNLEKIDKGKTPIDVKQLRIASYNVRNLKYKDPRVEYIAGIIRKDLNSPSIVGLVEIGDDSESQVGESGLILEALCVLLNSDDDNVDYKYTYIKAEGDRDGGEPGSNIKQAILYDSVIFEEIGSHGEHTDNCDNHFTKNPCRIDPNNPVFDGSRKPLAAKFVVRSTRVPIVVIVNHFKSKIRVRKGEKSTADFVRMRQAAVVADFINQFETGNLVAIGDFNDTWDSKTYEVINSVMRDTSFAIDDGEKYTHSFKGNFNQIDYVFATEDMMKSFVNAGIMHKYNKKYSDHYPVYADFNIKKIK